MKKARMSISHFRFILFNLKIFGETDYHIHTLKQKQTKFSSTMYNLQYAQQYKTGDKL